jgi:diguanylate cyclase (GGDEF)-like protein
MEFPYAANVFLGSGLLLVLIFIDYFRKYNTDSFQRRIFFRILICTFIPLICDYAYYLLRGLPAGKVHVFFVISFTVFYAFQVHSYYCIFVFVDYLAHRDEERTRSLARFCGLVTGIHAALLLLNLPLGFYFYLPENNRLYKGSLYFIRFILSYAPAGLALGDAVIFRKNFRNSQILLILLFLIFYGAASAVEFIFNISVLVWPCSAAALLYAYFFIVHTDLKIDSLTGIGNRFSFNEFIDMLEKTNTRQAWSIVMIDMDHFKEINDRFGHQEGDNALRDMAAIIKGCIRHSDFAARYGGDEFILAARAEYDIEKLIFRIQESMNNQNAKKLRPFTLEMSYGCDVFVTKSNQSIASFLKHIDAIMYRHKAERKRRREEKEEKQKKRGKQGGSGD